MSAKVLLQKQHISVMFIVLISTGHCGRQTKHKDENKNNKLMGTKLNRMISTAID